MNILAGDWVNISSIHPNSFYCGYCGVKTGVKIGYTQNNGPGLIYICGGCNRPTYFERLEKQIPAPILGNPVLHLSHELESLYDQARRCTQIEAYTATTLICRKILMHVAVECGAQAGLKFIEYVEFLSNNGYIPPNGKAWVDVIRNKGNEANHEIVIMQKDDAAQLLKFIEMLLKFIFEFAAEVPGQQANP
jgi:hypothetical protein